MGAGAVAAGDEGVLAVGDGLEGGLDVSGVLDARGIGGRAAEYKVVIHPVQALGLHAVDHIREAVGNEGLLLLLGVDQDQVGVAHLGVGDGLAGAGGVDLHLVAVLLLENGQQVAQQTGVVDGGGGGKADVLGLLGGLGNLGGGDGAAVLEIEQVFAVLFKSVVGSQVLAFLGKQPVDQRRGAHGVEFHVRNRVAVGVDKGSVGIHGQQAVVVDHGVVRLHEDAGVDHQRVSLGGGLFRRRSFFDRGRLCCRFFHGSGSLGGRRGGSRALPAGSQRKNHDHRQEQGYDLFHFGFPPKKYPLSRTKQAQMCCTGSAQGKRLVHRLSNKRINLSVV